MLELSSPKCSAILRVWSVGECARRGLRGAVRARVPSPPHITTQAAAGSSLWLLGSAPSLPNL